MPMTQLTARWRSSRHPARVVTYRVRVRLRVRLRVRVRVRVGVRVTGRLYPTLYALGILLGSCAGRTEGHVSRSSVSQCRMKLPSAGPGLWPA